MKVKCPDCSEKFEISVNDYDEGDDVECPECCIGLVVQVNGGRFKLVSEREKFFDDEGFDDYDED